MLMIRGCVIGWTAWRPERAVGCMSGYSAIMSP
jgi:hypothetical protein